jgi:hypothetical protein
MTARPLLLLPLALLLGCPTGPDELETVSVTLTDTSAGPRFLDLQAGTEVDEADGWDVRIDGWNLFLNGGESGDGKSGGIDMELLDLDLTFEEMNRRNQLVWFLFFDSYACAISDWWWYGLDGTHTLFSNYHTYVVRKGDRDFALQVLDYYRVVDGFAEAGYPEFRWAEIPTDGRAPEVWTEDLDATAGGVSADADDPTNRWTYFSFDDGEVSLSDAEALESEAWDLGFKRFNVKSNSGPSGPGSVMTVDFERDRGETAEEVLAFTREAEEPGFLAAVDRWDPSANEPFVEDAVQPVLRRWYRGQPGNDGDAPELQDGRWFLATDRTGEALAKLRVTGFEGTGAAGPDSLTLEWAVIP